jgi:hypothetical protein
VQGIEVYGLASRQSRLIGERDESPTFDERAADVDSGAEDDE